MRFLSGVTDQYLPFEALDVDDGVTPLSGLSSFTVYRTRNGAAAVAYTTPTITERRPGLYWLLLDEDMTIDSGDDEQAVAIEISHAGMQTVRTGFELCRVKYTAGATLDDSAIRAAIGLAIANIDAQLAAIDGAIMSGADLRGAVGLASANMDTQLGAIKADTSDTKNASESVEAIVENVAYGNAAIKTSVTALPSLSAIRADVERSGGMLQTTSGYASTAASESSQAKTSAASAASQTTASAIRATVGLAAADLDSQLGAIDGAIMSGADLRGAVGLASANIDTQLGAIKSDTNTAKSVVENVTYGNAAIKTSVAALPSISAIRADVERAGGMLQVTQGHASSGATSSGVAQTQTVPSAIRSAVGLASANLDTQLVATTKDLRIAGPNVVAIPRSGSRNVRLILRTSDESGLVNATGDIALAWNADDGVTLPTGLPAVATNASTGVYTATFAIPSTQDKQQRFTLTASATVSGKALARDFTIQLVISQPLAITVQG